MWFIHPYFLKICFWGTGTIVRLDRFGASITMVKGMGKFNRYPKNTENSKVQTMLIFVLIDYTKIIVISLLNYIYEIMSK